MKQIYNSQYSLHFDKEYLDCSFEILLTFFNILLASHFFCNVAAINLWLLECCKTGLWLSFFELDFRKISLFLSFLIILKKITKKINIPSGDFFKKRKLFTFGKNLNMQTLY